MADLVVANPMTVAPERFTHGGREWIAEPCVIEENDRHYTKIKASQRGAPWPSIEEYRQARDHYFLMQRCAELSREHIARYPKIIAKLAEC